MRHRLEYGAVLAIRQLLRVLPSRVVRWLGAAVGLLIGALAGGFGGWVDSVLMRLMDIMLAVPGLLFAIAVAAVLTPSLKAVMIAIAVVNVPVFARLLRASMLSQRESDYALAARMVGVKRRRIVVSHVLPNSLAPVIVQGTLALGTAFIDASLVLISPEMK